MRKGDLSKFIEQAIAWLPRVKSSPDPTDDYLLTLCEAGKADYLVTGGKSGPLSLTVTRVHG